jgi:hypothetical protein
VIERILRSALIKQRSALIKQRFPPDCDGECDVDNCWDCSSFYCWENEHPFFKKQGLAEPERWPDDGYMTGYLNLDYAYGVRNVRGNQFNQHPVLALLQKAYQFVELAEPVGPGGRWQLRMPLYAEVMALPASSMCRVTMATPRSWRYFCNGPWCNMIGYCFLNSLPGSFNTSRLSLPNRPSIILAWSFLIFNSTIKTINENSVHKCSCSLVLLHHTVPCPTASKTPHHLHLLWSSYCQVARRYRSLHRHPGASEHRVPPTQRHFLARAGNDLMIWYFIDVVHHHQHLFDALASDLDPVFICLAVFVKRVLNARRQSTLLWQGLRQGSARRHFLVCILSILILRILRIISLRILRLLSLRLLRILRTFLRTLVRILVRRLTFFFCHCRLFDRVDERVDCPPRVRFSDFETVLDGFCFIARIKRPNFAWTCCLDF